MFTLPGLADPDQSGELGPLRDAAWRPALLPSAGDSDRAIGGARVSGIPQETSAWPRWREARAVESARLLSYRAEIPPIKLNAETVIIPHAAIADTR